MNFIKNTILIFIIAAGLSAAKSSQNDISHIFTQRLKPYICYKNEKCDLSSINSWYIDEFKYWVQNSTSLCRNNYDQFRKDISEKKSLPEKWGLEFFKSPGPSDILTQKWINDGPCVDELEYFYKSLELFNKYNMNQILHQNNVLLNNNYTAQQIFDAVSKGLGGKKSKVECFESNGTIRLYKISLYFDKSFNLIDSPRSYSKCEPDTTIFYVDHVWREPLVPGSFPEHISH